MGTLRLGDLVGADASVGRGVQAELEPEQLNLDARLQGGNAAELQPQPQATKAASAASRWLDETAFAAAVRAQAARHRGLCALDLALENVSDFEYGRWTLVRRDLRELLAAAALPPSVDATVRRVCAA